MSFAQTDALFSNFYQARETFLKAPGDPGPLLAAARVLAERGEESALIVGRELRQTSHVTGIEISSAVSRPPRRSAPRP
jgi:hypothetical protein